MTDLLENTSVIAIAGLVVLLFLLGGLVASRYKVAKPNEAYIITGRRGKTSGDLSGQKVVTGGGVFVVPLVQQLHVLDLSSRRIAVQITGAVSAQGIRLRLDGVAILKVGGDEQSIRAAAQRFLTQQSEIETFTTEVLAGALRSIVGGLTVEQIIRDRASFAQQVAEVAEQTMTGQGLVLDAFQIQDITDDGSYLTDLGRPEAARAKQQAEIAEAESRKLSEQKKLAVEQEILDNRRTLALREAEIKVETDTASAAAEAAGPQAQAVQQQVILTEQEKVAQRQAALTERQLDTEVRKPADAARYQAEQEAEARRIGVQLSADADRYTREQKAIAEKAATVAGAEARAAEDTLTGNAEKSRRLALADAVRAEGDARASAIAAEGNAEAEAMDAKAAAFEKYNNAAVLQMLIEVLPEIAEKLAAPMGNIDNLTVVSTDGAGALPKTVASTFTQLQEMVKASTGVDLAGAISNLSGTGPALVDGSRAT